MILLGKHVAGIDFSRMVSSAYETVVVGFAYGVFIHLEVAETFGSHVLGPLDCGGVVTEDRDGAAGESRVEFEVFEEINEMDESFDELIHCVDFSFGSGTGSDSLTFA